MKDHGTTRNCVINVVLVRFTGVVASNQLEEKAGQTAKGNWRDAIGFAKDDALFSEAMRLGAELRTKASKEGH